MLLSYFFNAYRFFIKNRLNTIFNLISLTLGIATITVIFLYVISELTHNFYYKYSDRIARISITFLNNANKEATQLAWSNSQLVYELSDNFAEVEQSTGFSKQERKLHIRISNDIFYEDNFWYADKSYFKVFAHSWISGDPATALASPNSIVLTDKLAKKYFGSQNPLNKFIIISDQELRVTGVIEKPPINTDFDFDAIIAKEAQHTDWCYVFALLRVRNSITGLQENLNAHMEEIVQPILDQSGFTGLYHAEGLRDIYFSDQKMFDFPKGRYWNIYAFTFIGLLILIISIVNFINFSITNSLKRQSEIGIRKVFGAQNSQITLQFFLESILVVSFCLSLSCIVLLSLSKHINYFQAIGYVPFAHKIIIIPLGFLSIVVGIGLIGCFYSFAYSRYSSTIQNIKSTTESSTSILLKDILITVQIIGTISLIFATLIVNTQMNFLSKYDTKLNEDKVVVIDVPRNNFLDFALNGIKNSFIELPDVVDVSIVGDNSYPTSNMSFDGFQIGDESNLSTIKVFNYISIDESYFNVLGVKLKEGRNFESLDRMENRPVIIVNETLVKAMGWIHATGKIISDNEVIGVVEDFNFQGLLKKTEPILFKLNTESADKMLVRLSKSSPSITEGLKDIWVGHTKQPFEYNFLDKYFAKQLENENSTRILLLCFSVLAGVIAMLGLFVNINIQIEQKLKEISIRKILGADNMDILAPAMKKYGIILLVASLISYPLTLFNMNTWLEIFALKKEIELSQFSLAVMAVSVLLLITIQYQAYRLKKINPVKTIKNA